ncbi:MAG: ABC-F family ATP-binding cassette domain-containing protein [Anaerolineales bacterium]|nr:ABC-F family ATP-binding cassette domain-containing protein [Anaerolineales bacterium]
MLIAHHLTKSYGLDTVVADVSVSIGQGDRAGLVGPNGSGKTTLLRLLAGVERPDSGTVSATPASLHLGYLPQGLEFSPAETIGGYLDRAGGDVAQLEAEVERLAGELAHKPRQPAVQRAYDAALSRLTAAVITSGRVPVVLAALGLGHLPIATKVNNLSGGQKTRLALASVLLADPDLLLLDEPTNHLDIGMLAWLEGWLTTYRGAVLVVSHDRAFLDRTVNRIIELDAMSHQTREYPGSYTDFVEAKLAEQMRQQQAYTDQQMELARLRNAARHLRGLARFRKGGKADSGDKFAKGFFADRSLGTVGRAKRLEARIQHLLTDEKLEKPRPNWQMKLDFGAAPVSGQDVLVLENLSVGYGDLPLLTRLNAGLRVGARVALIGPNGSGKTTLVRTIAGRQPPLAGRVRLGSNVRVGYMAQEQESLDATLNPLETIRRSAPLTETDARAFLHFFLFTQDDVFVPVGKLSFGERARLALGSLVVAGCNFLLLDEPINHLDLPSRARFEQALEQFEGTVLAVVHDRYFIEGFASEIWEIVDGGLRVEPAG